MRVRAFVLLALVLLLPTPALADDAVSLLDEGPVRVDEPPAHALASWKGAFVLEARENATLTFRVTALRSERGALVEPSKIHVQPSEASVEAGKRYPFRLEVEGVPVPGAYAGKLVVEAVAANGTRFRDVALPILIDAPAPVIEMETAPHTSLTLCGGGCGFGRLLAPAQASSNVTIQVRNNGTRDVSLEGASLRLHLEGAWQGRDVSLRLPDNRTLRPGGAALLVADLGNVTLPPGKYEGSLELTLAEAAPPTRLPVSLDVRASPWIALFAITAGVLLALLTQLVKTRVNPQLAAMRHLAGLQREAGPPPRDPKIQGLLDKLAEKVARGDLADFQVLAEDAHDAIRRARHEAVLLRMGKGATESPSPRFLDKARAWWHQPLFQMARGWGLKLLLGLAGLLLLLFVGLQELYGNAATFGASGFDVLPLVLWGFTGKVATTSLRETVLPLA